MRRFLASISVRIMADYWTLASNSSSLATVSPTSFPTADWDTHGRVVPLTVLLVLLIFIIVFGNSLVVLAVFYERRLRLPSNYYVVSLAVADLAIGIAVVPISAVYEIATRWLLGQALCRMWISADITCCTASIINLCAISFDRYRALSQPMLYPQYSTAKRSCITITGIWAASLAISTPTLFGVGIEKRQSNQCLLAKRSAFVVFSACGSFFIPLCIMLVLYRLIFKIANKQRRKIQRGQSVGFSHLNNDMYADSGSEMSLNHSPCLQSASGRPLLLKQQQQQQQQQQQHPNRPHNLPALILQRDSCASFTGIGVPAFKSSPKGSVSSGDSIAIASSSHAAALAQQRRQSGRRPKLLAKNPVAQRLRRLGSHTKAAKTLGIVVGAFVFCWGPFFFTYLLHGVCYSCRVPDTLVKYFVWLGYCNSFLNPIIYPCLNKDFRRAFRKLLTRHYCKRKSLDYWNSRRQSVTQLIKASRHLRVSIQDTNYTGSSGTPPESPYSSSRSPSFFSSRSGSFLSPMDALKRSRADSRQSSEDDGASAYQELLPGGHSASWRRRLSSRRSSSRRFSFLSSSSGYTCNRTDQRLSCASTDTRSTDMTDKVDGGQGGSNLTSAAAAAAAAAASTLGGGGGGGGSGGGGCSIDSKDPGLSSGVYFHHHHQPLHRRQSSLKIIQKQQKHQQQQQQQYHPSQASASSTAYQHHHQQQHQRHHQEDPDAIICEDDDQESQQQQQPDQPAKKRKSRTNSLPAIFEKIEVKLWQRRRTRKSKKIRDWLATDQSSTGVKDTTSSVTDISDSDAFDDSGPHVSSRMKESALFHHPIRQASHPACGMTRRNTVSGNRPEPHRRPSLLVNDTLIDFNNSQDHRLSIYTIEESPRRESGSSCSGFSFSRTSGFRLDKAAASSSGGGGGGGGSSTGGGFDREGSEVSQGSQGDVSGQTSPRCGRTAKRESLTVESVWSRVNKQRPSADSSNSSANGHERTPSPSQSVISQSSGFGLEHLYSGSSPGGGTGGGSGGGGASGVGFNISPPASSKTSAVVEYADGATQTDDLIECQANQDSATEPIANPVCYFVYEESFV